MNRKRLYKKCFHAFEFGLVESGERKSLPYCVEAKARQCFPEENGPHMDSKEHLIRASMAFYACCHTNLYADNLE